MVGTETQILDRDFLRRQTAGDAALERDLLRLLLGQCAAVLPILIAADDPKARRDAAHGLRGAAAGLGAMRLAAVTEAIERDAPPAVPIERAVAEVRDAVERHLADEEACRSAA